MEKEELEENLSGFCGDIKEFTRKGDYRSALILVESLGRFIRSLGKEQKQEVSLLSSDRLKPAVSGEHYL